MRSILLVALLVACGDSKPFDKKAGCETVYTAYQSHQDKKVWSDACMAAPDETIRCLSLVMEEGKDSACMKAVNSPERSKLVPILNGRP